MATRRPRHPSGPPPPSPSPSPKGVKRTYDLEEIKKLWMELREASKVGTLALPEQFPGLDRGKVSSSIKRIRKALLDDEIGLGMQLRWSIALNTLRQVAIPPGARTSGDARVKLCEDCGINLKTFNQLGSMGGDLPETEALTLYRKINLKKNLARLCDCLTDVNQSAYRQVSNQHRMTPALFRTPYRGDGAIDDFLRLLRTGEPSRKGKVNHRLMDAKKQYFDTPARKEPETELIARLARPNACQPIQCITANGAQTAVEALAWHLAESLPDRLEGLPVPRRDIYLVPCGRWVHPSAFRGMEYLVSNLVHMLRNGRVDKTSSDMSESELQQEIVWLREYLGQRPVIFIFVGHDALGGPLARLQEAVADAPLAGLLSHLSRPALGTEDHPFDPRHFQWTYFLVIGTAELASLGEYMQPTLDWPAIHVKYYPRVLEEAKFSHGAEIYEGMRDRAEPESEAALCLFEQIRRIETIRAGEGQEIEPSNFKKYYGLRPLSKQFFIALDDPQRRIVQAFVLLTAFAIGGIKRPTLIRCLTLWRGVFPDRVLEQAPGTAGEWTRFFKAWLDCFKPIIRSGPDEHWREVDPRLHPFEYAGSLQLNLSTDRKVWWDQSIDFLIADVRDAIVTYVQETEPALAEGIHRILAEESLRQHTMVLRHTSRADRLTMRSHRRGLQALFHGLSSLPRDFDAHSGDTVSDPNGDLDLNLPSKHMQRFQYMYCGLFPSLLRDDTLGHFGAAWGADSIKLEIALYADDLLFRRIDTVPPAMLTTHAGNLAAAAVRAGSSARWKDVRSRLEVLARTGANPDGVVRLTDKVLLHMNLIEHGPESARTIDKFEELAGRLGVTLDLDAWTDEYWRLSTGPQVDFPTVKHHRALVDRLVAEVRDKSGSRRSDISTLLFIFGMMRADAAELRLNDHTAAADEVWRSLSQLLKCFSILLAARRLMWDGYGEEHCPLPYLAAEGLRTLCRVGLEAMRVLNKHGPSRQGDAKGDIATLVSAVTSRVRQCLDEYTRVFHANEIERTQMLILESRFARLAYSGDPARAAQDSLDIVVQSNRKDRPAAAEGSRYELALKFLNEAENCLLSISAADNLRIRLLSERCSTLRYLATNLANEPHVNPDLRNRAGMLERAATACALAALDVQQMKNIIARLSRSRNVWLAAGAKAKWSATAEYHSEALGRLSGRLEAMQRSARGVPAAAEYP